jgi:hypothetical protein
LKGSRARFGAACVVCAALLVCAATAAAQEVPRKKSNLTRADRAAWYKVLRWPDEFEERWQQAHRNSEPSYSGLTFHELGGGQHLVEINVFPGGYQPIYIFMLYDERTARAGPGRLLRFKRFGEDARGRPAPVFETEIFGFPEFKARTRRLEIYSKSRGSGDCGSFITYRFAGGTPVVAEARERDCVDPPPDVIDPRRWPRKKL